MTVTEFYIWHTTVAAAGKANLIIISRRELSAATYKSVFEVAYELKSLLLSISNTGQF